MIGLTTVFGQGATETSNSTDINNKQAIFKCVPSTKCMSEINK